MNSRVIRNTKRDLYLTKSQQEILVGLLLGDGHLEKRGNCARLKVEHGCSQKMYTQWLATEFSNWIQQGICCKQRGGEPASWWFNTCSHKAFLPYASLFYEEKRKVVPDTIKTMLSPRALAVWFMDDGSRKSRRHKTYIIHTLGFSKQDLQNVQSALVNEFGVETTLHKQRNTQWRIYIPSRSASRFKKIVEPYVIPSLRYKLG